MLLVFRETISYEEIPDEYKKECGKRRSELIESLSNADEHIGDLYLNEKIPTKQEIKVD